MKAGRKIGPYCVYATIGRGTSAELYEAEHLCLDRQVALKILPPGRGVRRFLDEARLLSRLSDPGLVKIFDCEPLPDGGAYLAMELLHGELLSQRLQREKRLPLLELVDITGQLARALEVMHQAGLVHRDVEPANIMLCGDRVKLLDFRVVPIDALLGTPYMAPEQCRGEPALDRRADVYALGALVFEMASGHPPDEAHLDSRALPAMIARVAARAMKRSPEDRYPGTLALASALVAGTIPF